MKIANGLEELIGATPTVALDRFTRALSLEGRILAKHEAANPGGSAKDRVAMAMLDAAEEAGLLKPGATVIEPTSGNTGIGLCALCAARGYRAVIVMPDTMSVERRALMAAYGASLVLTPGAEGMAGAIRRAEELAAEIPGAFIPGQFENPANPDVHYRTTGPELYRDTEGRLDLFVAGVGTGGTISGVGRYLKEMCPNIRVVGVEPAASAVLSGGTPAPHGLQGIGAGFIPKTLDTAILDEVIGVKEEDAVRHAALLARTEGLLVGFSGGAALAAAAALLARPECRGKTVAVILPDTGERYLSTLYANYESALWEKK